MDFELYPTESLKERSFNFLVPSREHFVAMFNRNLNLQRYEVLFVTGNHSGILSERIGVSRNWKSGADSPPSRS
jgi:hypothetical protein